MTGIAIFGHGSRVETANQAIRDFTEELARRGGYALVEASFLELGEPDLPEAVRRLVKRGATRIVVIPYFLTLGTHLQRDLPRIVGELEGIHIGVKIIVTQPMDGHPALVQVILDRAKDAIDGGGDFASTVD